MGRRSRQPSYGGSSSSGYPYNQGGGLAADYNADLEAVGALATWTDRSGSGNHLAQAVGAKQPTVVAGVINGKKVVRTDGVDDFMAKIGFVLGANEFSAYVVASLAAVGSNSIILGYNLNIVVVGHNGATGNPSLTRGVGTVTYATNVAGAGFALRSSQSRNDGTNELFYQGASRGSVSDATAILTTGVNLDMGALNGGAGFFFQGDIARILIYNKRHTTVVRSQIETQLIVDYNLT